MSQMIDEAVKELNQKTGGSFDGSAKFVVEDEGTIMLDGEGARAADTSRSSCRRTSPSATTASGTSLR